MACAVVIGLQDISTSVSYLYIILKEHSAYNYLSQHTVRTHAKTHRLLLLSQRYSMPSLSSTLLPHHTNHPPIGVARTTLPNSPTP